MPAPADIEGKVLAGGLIKMLNVVVQSKGERSASDVVVRIPVSKSDKYFGGWMSKSEAPSVLYMLGARTEYRFHKLLPGDSVTFYLKLGNLNSDLAHRIEVFDADGRRAEYDPYVRAHYFGSKAKGWIYVLGLIVGVIRLLSVSWTRRPKQPAVSSDSQIPADTTEHLLASSAGPTAQEQERRHRNASDGMG